MNAFLKITISKEERKLHFLNKKDSKRNETANFEANFSKDLKGIDMIKSWPKLSEKRTILCATTLVGTASSSSYNITSARLSLGTSTRYGYVCSLEKRTSLRLHK